MKTIVISMIGIGSILFVVMIQHTASKRMWSYERAETSLSSAMEQTMSEVMEENHYGIENRNEMLAALLQSLIAKWNHEIDLTVLVHKMDYDKMLDYHKEMNADATIAVIEVPMKEASRFGIMNTDGNGRIVEFEEKPEHPKSNLASMGIYIFNWKLLRKILLADMKNPDSHHDFGKDVIPCLLNDNKTLAAYKFKGYWKDVGTIDSLWEANMDLIDSRNELNLNDPTWKIYTEDTPALPQYIGPNAKIDKAFITQGCVVEGEVKHSVLFTGCKVGEGAKIIDSVLMPGVEVAAGAVVQRALVADNVKIGQDAVVGSADSENIELVSKRVKGVE